VRHTTLSKARGKAKKIIGRVEDGEDVAATIRDRKREGRQRTDTFEALATGLLEKADLGDRTRYEWGLLLKSHVFPLIGGLAPKAVSRDKVWAAIERVNSPSRANDVLKVIRWTYRRAAGPPLFLEHDPTLGLKRPTKDLPRDRVLTTAELRAVWVAAGECGLYGTGVRVAILTGARRGEVFGASWAEIDRERRLWTIPAARRAKSHQALQVPIARALDRMLAEIGDNSPWLLPSPVNATKPMHPTSRAWGGLLAEAGLEADPKSDARIRFHDLRRSMRDRLTELRVSGEVAEALLGHAAPKLVRTYAPSGVPLADRRRAAERWAREVERIVTGKRAKVARIS
jgi:integrase